MSVEMGGFSPESESTNVSVKERLENLKLYMPGEEEMIYKFALFLSTRIHDTLSPEGFETMATLALEDLKTGKDGFTHEPISSDLVGLDKSVYVLLEMYLPDIKTAVFGEEK